MSIDMPPDLEEFVEYEVTSGHFQDRRSVIEHALRLMHRDREEAIQGIRAGLADENAGRVQPFEEAFADLRQEIDLREDE